MTFDITKHKCSDSVLSLTPHNNLLELRLFLSQSKCYHSTINKNDVTVMAKHFHDLMTDDEKVDFWDTMYEGYERHFGDISQSETTIKDADK